jgi:DNA polymerase-1
MAINAPIQGTEADVLKLAMIAIDEYVQRNHLEDKVRLLLQVHDELVYEIADAEVATVAPVIRKLMESVIDPKDIEGITLTSSAAAGPNWEAVTSL